MYDDVKEYISKLYNTDNFDDLDSESQEQLIFSACELLKDNYKESKITTRIVALQTLYMLGNESNEYIELQKNGIESYSNKGVSVSFNKSTVSKYAGNETGGISPDVIAILGIGDSGLSKVGRLI